MEPGIGVVNLHKLTIVGVAARSGLPHDFRERDRRRAAAGRQRFVRIRDRPDHRVGRRIADLQELRRDSLVRLVAIHGEAKVELVGHRDGLAGQEGPRLAVVTGKAAEQIAYSIEAQPGVWVIIREAAGGLTAAAGWVAPLEETSVD